jgi:Holliday junction resolvasome RuvABC endonuclease subunit
MTVRILAIDPGSNCGYAVMDVPQPVSPYLRAKRDTAGIWDLQQKRFEGYGMRFIRLKKHLLEVNPDFVAYEQVNFPHKSTAAANMYGALLGIITSFCEEQHIAYAGVYTSDVKKKATGKGGGKGTDKPAIVSAANVFFNITNPPLDESASQSNKDHNIADALWIMQIALEEFAASIKPKEKLMPLQARGVVQ